MYVLAGRRASRLLERGWNFFRPERNKSFDILPASRQVAEQLWYEGEDEVLWAS
jgi:glucose-1-phosphate adenylyltransferase